MVKNRFFKLLQAKETRDGRLWTYQAISQVTGLSEKGLAKWRFGRVSRFDAWVVEALCSFLECELGELLVLECPVPEKYETPPK